MNNIQNLKLDLEIAWYWAMSKYQQSLRTQSQRRQDMILVNR